MLEYTALSKVSTASKGIPLVSSNASHVAVLLSLPNCLASSLVKPQSKARALRWSILRCEINGGLDIIDKPQSVGYFRFPLKKNWIVIGVVYVLISTISVGPIDVINPSIFWGKIAKTHNLAKIKIMPAPVVTPVGGYFVT